MQWMFNTTRSPCMAGAMVALIKITKRCLTALVKNRLLHEDILHTVLLETESIVNSRSLTSVNGDIGHLEPLTPNQFLIGQSSLNTNLANSRTKWKSVQAVTNMYWKRWIKGYLL